MSHASTRNGPGGHRHKARSYKTLLAVVAISSLLAATHAAPLNSVEDAAPTQALLRSAHPLSRRSVDAPLAGEAPARQRDNGQAHHDKRQTSASAVPRQGVISFVPVDPASTVSSAVSAAVSTPAAATAVRAASSSSSSSTASPTSTSAHTGFTLTDTQNKLYPLWIVVLIAGIFGGLFVVLCTVRWCIFRPHGKQDPDAYLTGGAAGRGRSIRAGAKSLRKALTKRKLAGSSFARRKQEGSVLLEVGDEVFAVPPSVAEEYHAAKKMFGGGAGSASSSSTGHGTTTGNPFSWNGKAYLAQCLTRYEADKKRAADARSTNIDAWTRSNSTLVTDGYDEKAGGRNEAYGAKGWKGDDSIGDESFDDNKPKRGLSGRLAAGLRAAMRGNREDEDDELGDPEKTTDLSTFLPAVSKHANANGWAIAPTPITKDTPRMPSSAAAHDVPRPLPAVTQKSVSQQTRMQPRGVALDDEPHADARNRITTRRFPHDPVLLNGANGQQRTGTVKKVRVNSNAEAIGTPIWEQNARSRVVSSQEPGAHSRVVSSQEPGGRAQDSRSRVVSSQEPGGLTPAPRENRAVSASRGARPQRSATSGQHASSDQKRRHTSQRSNTVRVPRREGGAEVRLDRE